MTVLGLPLTTVAVIVATILAGSSGAIHYLLVYKVLGRPFPGQNPETTDRSAEAE